MPGGVTNPYAPLDEYVATRSGATPPEGVTYTADPVATVRELKQRDGLGIYLCGGGQLAGSLLPEIDRLILKRYPLVLGYGIRLFGNADATVAPFTFVGCRTFESGSSSRSTNVLPDRRGEPSLEPVPGN